MAWTIRLRWTLVAALTTAMVTLGMALAQDQTKKAEVRSKSSSGSRKSRKGGLFAGGGNPPKNAPQGAADPLAKAQAQGADAKANANAAPDEAEPRWPYHYKFKLIGPDGVGTTARFYPSRSGASAPVLMLVHQGGTGHSGADFEEAIEDAAFKGQSLAEYFQDKDYAVLILDRRGHGPALARQQVSSRDPATLIGDLQTGYTFLIDRNNRRELNLTKFGVIAVGDGANLAALWAASPTGGVSNPGRVSDIGALVLISPQAESFQTQLTSIVAPLAPRLPMMIIGGERDADVFKAVRPLVERNRQSRGMLFDTRLQADRLIRFEAKAIEQSAKFLEDPVKFRTNAEWEPRYLLTPVAYSDIELIEAPANAAAAQPEAAKKAAEPAKKKDEAEKKADVPAKKDSTP